MAHDDSHDAAVARPLLEPRRGQLRVLHIDAPANPRHLRSMHTESERARHDLRTESARMTDIRKDVIEDQRHATFPLDRERRLFFGEPRHGEHVYGWVIERIAD